MLINVSVHSISTTYVIDVSVCIYIYYVSVCLSVCGHMYHSWETVSPPLPWMSSGPIRSWCRYWYYGP